MRRLRRGAGHGAQVGLRLCGLLRCGRLIGRLPDGAGRVPGRVLGRPQFVRQLAVLLAEPLDLGDPALERVFAVGERGDGLGELFFVLPQPLIGAFQAQFQIPVAGLGILEGVAQGVALLAQLPDLGLEVFRLGVEGDEVDAQFLDLGAEPVDLVVAPCHFLLARFGEPRGVGEVSGQGGDPDIALGQLRVEPANARLPLLDGGFGRYLLGAQRHQVVAEPGAARDAFGEKVAIVLEIDRQAGVLGGEGGPGHVLFGADLGHRQRHAGADAPLGQAHHTALDDRRDDQRDQGGREKPQRE